MYNCSYWLQSGQCFDLSLPSTYGLYDARLITVFECGDQPAAACVAVSREGSVRFWHNVSLEGTYTDLKAELNGGEFAMIVALEVCVSCVCLVIVFEMP